MNRDNTTKKRARKTSNLILVFLLLLLTNLAFANSKELPSIFDELSYQETMEVTLEMDMNAVFGNRRNNEKHKTIFSYQDKNGATQTWDINVKLRGRFRRTRCEGLAPLKLNFKKGDLKAAGLSKYDDMKLVTHCVADKKEAKQLLVKEYLAYKIFNHISEESFRVQFLKINYKDSKTGAIDEQWGILIEDTAELRARIQAEKSDKLYNLERDKFNLDTYKKVAFFQYMIGNKDWSSNRLHNVKLLNKSGKYIIVPYDFDFSGIVDAPYATISDELNIENNKDRVYLGFGEDLENFEATIQFYNLKKETLLQMIKDCELLSRKDRREIVRYLKSFYKNIEQIHYPFDNDNSPTLGE